MISDRDEDALSYMTGLQVPGGGFLGFWDTPQINLDPPQLGLMLWGSCRWKNSAPPGPAAGSGSSSPATPTSKTASWPRNSCAAPPVGELGVKNSFFGVWGGVLVTPTPSPPLAGHLVSHSTPIRWWQGQDPRCRPHKGRPAPRSFFAWFGDHSFPAGDRVAEVSPSTLPVPPSMLPV